MEEEEGGLGLTKMRIREVRKEPAATQVPKIIVSDWPTLSRRRPEIVGPMILPADPIAPIHPIHVPCNII